MRMISVVHILREKAEQEMTSHLKSFTIKISKLEKSIK